MRLATATLPLRSGERSDNLPLVSQRRPPWLFVQPVERRSRMERPVRSVLAAPRKARARSHRPAAGLADNVAGALAYVTIIPAIVFLVLEPFNKKRFVRFHAFQCIFFAIAWIVLWIGLSFIGHIPFLGWATSSCGRWSVWPGL